jgi:hypothetical protein
MLIDINGDGLPDRVFDRNPKTNQTGLFVYLNTGNGFDSGKQWQSNLGGPGNWKNRPTHENGEHSMLMFFQLSPRLACHCLPLTPNDASLLFHLNFVFGRQRPLFIFIMKTIQRASTLYSGLTMATTQLD